MPDGLDFDVYGRFRLHVCRSGGQWVVFHVEEGKRRRADDIVVPSHLSEADVGGYLDDLFHEYSAPGAIVRRVGSTP